MYTAALIGTAELIEFLLSAGTNAKAKDKEGKTPFDVAKKSDAFKGTDAYWKLNDAQYN